MKRVLVLFMCLVMATALVACAPKTTEGSAAPSASADASEEAAQSTESASTADTIDGLQKVKDAGKLVMLTNATFPPYEYLGEGNHVAGVDVEVAQAIADEIGVSLEVIDMDFDGLLTAVQTGKGDIVAAGMTITPERQEAVDFSIPYTEATQVIIVNKEDPKVASPDDLEGKAIGVQLGTTGDIYVSDMIEKEGAKIEISRYKSNHEAAMDLQNGRIDAIVLDELPAKSIAGASDSLTIIDEPFTVEQYAMAVAKGNKTLADVVNTVMQRMMDEGKILELTEKHIAAYAESL